MKNEVTIKDATLPIGKPFGTTTVVLTRAQLEAALKEINEPERVTIYHKDIEGRLEFLLSNGKKAVVEPRYGRIWISPPPEGHEWHVAPHNEIIKSWDLVLRKVGDPS